VTRGADMSNLNNKKKNNYFLKKKKIKKKKKKGKGVAGFHKFLFFY